MGNRNQMLSEKESRSLLYDKMTMHVFGAGDAIGSQIAWE